MATPMTAYRAARIGSAVLLTASAARHAVLASKGDGDVIRHVIFVVVNLGLGALLVWRPRWSFWPALALTIQQMASHGLDLSQSFLGTAPLDKLSLAVCLFFPTLVTILYLERQEDPADDHPG
jgi:hypothetical protein